MILSNLHLSLKDLIQYFVFPDPFFVCFIILSIYVIKLINFHVHKLLCWSALSLYFTPNNLYASNVNISPYIH